MYYLKYNYYVHVASDNIIDKELGQVIISPNYSNIMMLSMKRTLLQLKMLRSVNQAQIFWYVNYFRYTIPLFIQLFGDINLFI